MDMHEIHRNLLVSREMYRSRIERLRSEIGNDEIVDCFNTGCITSYKLVLEDIDRQLKLMEGKERKGKYKIAEFVGKVSNWDTPTERKSRGLL